MSLARTERRENGTLIRHNEGKKVSPESRSGCYFLEWKNTFAFGSGDFGNVSQSVEYFVRS